jgi:DNA-binding CsgD family transcriptional regulator
LKRGIFARTIRPMNAIQFDFTDSPDERLKKVEASENQLLLPVDPLQDQLNADDIVLTERELAIMQLVLTGVEIPQIAMKIFLSIAGVKWRLSGVYSKFNVRNRLQLIKKCSTTGLQFRTVSGVKHTFHNNLNLRAHDEK